MSIDIQRVLGAKLKSEKFDWRPRDLILYALGVGAGHPPADPDQLRFCFEIDPAFGPLPTFGVIPAFPALFNVGDTPGLEINPMMLLHGEQYLEIRSNSLPSEARTVTEARIPAVYDKGKGALLILETITKDERGNELFFNQFSLFLRGEGGFGGESGPPPGNDAPARAPDKIVEQTTDETQALLYRLSGDINPLHASPQFAAMGGFPRPILHGLCTFGYVGRAVLAAYCGNDPAKFRSIKVRFAKHVFPGETIVTKMWQDGKKILVEAEAKERGEKVITNAAVELSG